MSLIVISKRLKIFKKDDLVHAYLQDKINEVLVDI